MAGIAAQPQNPFDAISSLFAGFNQATAPHGSNHHMGDSTGMHAGGGQPPNVLNAAMQMISGLGSGPAQATMTPSSRQDGGSRVNSHFDAGQQPHPLGVALQALSGLAAGANQAGGVANMSPHNPSSTDTRPDVGQQPGGAANRSPQNYNSTGTQPNVGQPPHPYDHPLGAVIGLVAGVSQAVNAAGTMPQSGGRRPHSSARQQSRPFDAPAFAAGVGQAITAAAALQGPLQEALGNLNQFAGQGGARRSRGLDLETLNANTARVTYQGPCNSCASRHETKSGNEPVLENRCTVCCEDFQMGDELRILPCLHRYHQTCVDPWLRQNPACPICKHNVA